MKALLWKDCRVNQFVLIAGTVILLLPYLVCLIFITFTQWYWPVDQMRHWNYETVTVCGSISLMLSMVTIAMLGGNAMAAERADRSAEFLFYLPPSRRSLIASKIILAVGASLLIWIVNGVTLLVIAPRLPGAPSLGDGALRAAAGDRMLHLAVTAVLILGVAWLLSAFASAKIAAICGFIAPDVIVGALLGVHYLHPFPYLKWYTTLALTGGILSFIAGTLVYLRRYEP